MRPLHSALVRLYLSVSVVVLLVMRLLAMSFASTGVAIATLPS